MNIDPAALPEPYDTAFTYEPATRHGRIVFLAGQIAKTAPASLHAVGRCGEAVDLATARESARIAAGQALAWLSRQLAADERVERLLRVDVFVAVGAEFEAISEVAEAASKTFVSTLGDGGRHARSVIGVARLPRNAPVLLEVTAVIVKQD